ncbi:MAG: 50S ribosomal protein L6 [Candidatus Eisenbacteria bacterium]|uniref:Large ribosomal subunit protein uL6 n=1 Tax=Eiseniibacteriota bacterium TaxID=2212470 RepID=A0A7Y2E4T9_UNCEI|nr:50S ribosomal protein L6 [Candidatus Eisenbacteria bacterium]
MSRVGKQVITIPSGVELKLAGRTVSAKGPKGQLSYDILDGIEVEIEGAQAEVKQTKSGKNANAFHGLSRALINNLVLGVSQGFSKSLEIIGTGYRAQVQGKKITLALGFSHPIEYALPEGIEAKVEGQILTISGIDKAVVGQVAAEIRRFRPPEPYKGKGVRYTTEHVRRKAGKSATA